jgi:EpsI family protein
VTARALLLAALVLAASPLARGAGPAGVPLETSLAVFPRQLGPWRGVEGPPVAPEVVAVLGADDYLNRVYVDSTGRAAGLWVAYYRSQQQGDAIHSPLNCLPGTGWTPVARSRPRLAFGSERVSVNRYIVEKRGERQLVTYWFQGRGRIVASEYANKAYLLLDALRLRRTNGALVRIITPLGSDERTAEEVMAAFVGVLHERLARWIP